MLLTVKIRLQCITESWHYRSTNKTKDCFKIVAGEYDLRNDEGHEQSISFSISDVSIHENYNYSVTLHHDNDIALIRLKKPIDFRSRYVKPIDLVDPNIEYYNACK